MIIDSLTPSIESTDPLRNRQATRMSGVAGTPIREDSGAAHCLQTTSTPASAIV